MPAPARKPGPASVITRILLVQYVLLHRCDRVQAECARAHDALGSRPAPGYSPVIVRYGPREDEPCVVQVMYKKGMGCGGDHPLFSKRDVHWSYSVRHAGVT